MQPHSVLLEPSVLRGPPFGRLRPQLSITGRPNRRRGWASWAEEALLLPDHARRCDADRVQSALTTIRELRIGGDFWAPAPDLAGAARGELALLRPRSAAQALAMIREARRATPAARPIVSAPNAGWARALRRSRQAEGAVVLLGPVDPWPLLDRSAAVHATGDDPVAFLALAAGRPVRCVGAGDVSGWGLTEDGSGVPRRDARSLTDLAHAVLFSAVLYIDPFTSRLMVCEEAIELLAHWRRAIDRHRGVACCVGMSWWKRRAVAEMLHTGIEAPPFRRGAGRAVACARARGGAVAVWASRRPAELTARAAEAGVPVWQVEDGFVRSAGLGSDLTPPCSIVLDRRGLHYAPDEPSDLEVLLAETVFDPALLARAERLTAAIVARGLSKYNTGDGGGPPIPSGRRVVLAPGQVADDRSVRLGGAGVDGALELLRRVRSAEPDAFILFKPHPDVEAGHRPGAVADREARRYADLVVRDHALPALLRRVDAVHTLTSLTGFEALLRGREVIVHGQPFYSGWGLTRDLDPPPRRGRRLSLAELVAGALILYPLYRDPVTGLPCPPEVLVERLCEPAASGSLLSRAWRLQGALAARLRRSLSAERSA